jgi:acetylornithine deacetylase
MEQKEQQSSMSNDINILYNEAVELLKQLISTPSFSKEESDTAAIIGKFFAVKRIAASRIGNNIYALNKYFDDTKPTILLNSHHDTVKPNKGYTIDPFQPIEKEGKLFGLGSNDAGGSLVSLIATFLYFYPQQDLQYNIALAATAEEEISGTGGIEMVLRNEAFIQQTAGAFQLPFRGGGACAIVGEPTQMQMAVAERGLMVLDCVTHGKAGHAARNEGENALYKAMKDIEWFQNYQFEKNSELLGSCKFSVTSIETDNKQHNVVPAQCNFIVDVRVNEMYSFEELFEIVRTNIQSDVAARSMRLRSTMISLDHPLVKAGTELGRTYYGSPTTSDKALMPFPALKMGPGDSARSHTADEFIFLNEIKEGIELYIQLLNNVQ